MNRHAELILHWWPPLLVAIACIAAQALGWVDALRFERALTGAEPWRLLSGHLVHLGWAHVGMNLAGLMLIWALFGHALKPWVWVAAFVACGLAVGLGLYWHDTDLAWYVGLSGVLHGLLVLGGLASLRTERRMALFLLVGVAAKLAWEQFTGVDTGTAALVGGTVIVNAHLYGALGGLACVPLVFFGTGR